MPERMWRRRFEWMQHAACTESDDHTIPPIRYADEGSRVADEKFVEAICSSCRVRPECAEWASAGEHGIWSAGQYIPGHDEDRKRANEIRQLLADSVESEREIRGEDV